MSYKQPIYTLHNWNIIKYLFPNGTSSGNTYTVYIDSGTQLTNKLSRLRIVSPYLADLLAVRIDEGVIFERRGF